MGSLLRLAALLPVATATSCERRVWLSAENPSCADQYAPDEDFTFVADGTCREHLEAHQSQPDYYVAALAGRQPERTLSATFYSDAACATPSFDNFTAAINQCLADGLGWTRYNCSEDAAAPPKPVPAWTFTADVAVTGAEATDIFSNPPVYRNWSLSNYWAMDNATERAAFTKVETDGSIPNVWALWVIDAGSSPQTQTVNFPVGSATCDVFNVTEGYYTWPDSIFNLNTGFDDYIYSEAVYEGMVDGEFQKWVTRKGGENPGEAYYDCEYHINAAGAFSYIQWISTVKLDGAAANTTQLDVRSTFGAYREPSEADFHPPTNITCLPTPAPGAAPPRPRLA